MERNRQVHGHSQTTVARAVEMSTAEYRALITRDIPPPTFDQVVRLAAIVGADPVRAAMAAWSMTHEEACELGLLPTSGPIKVTQPLSRRPMTRKTGS
jgi:hypothetical protein